jgi:hypothetical protein
MFGQSTLQTAAMPVCIGLWTTGWCWQLSTWSAGWLAGWLAANTERDQLNDDDSS